MVFPGTNLSAVAIVGPTAVGKSDVADRLASRLSSEVLSCDAMQIYRGMDIGTAKMMPEECSVPLRLVDIVDPGVAYSAALYQSDARAHIERLLGEQRLPVFCGGTGLYLKAALDEMDFPSGELEDERRAGYQELAERIGEKAMHALLAERDPESAAVIHPHNVRRVVRALEAALNGEQVNQYGASESPYDALVVGLEMERGALYERINRRVDIMLEQGLEQEVRELLSRGLSPHCQSMQSIGYRQMVWYLQGTMDYEQAVEKLKQATRNFAKRQITWYKKMPYIKWLELAATPDYTNVVERICEMLVEKEISL